MTITPSGSERLHRLDKTPLQGRAYAHLKQALTAGLFRPGEVVTLKGVAESLGTSVMPVRDAVSRLVAQGALEMPTSRSIRVPQMSREHFEDLCRCRILVEGEAAGLAAQHIAQEAITRIEDINEQYLGGYAAGDIHGALVANQSFHFSVYQESGSKLLFSMIETLWLQSGPYLSLLMDTAADDSRTVDIATHHHERLIAALRRGDPEAARAALRADISDAADLYRSCMQTAS